MGEDETIAYTIGSFWFCVPCAQRPEFAGEYMEPVQRGNTLAVYEYRCDQPGCGRLIEPQKIKDVDMANEMGVR